MNLVWRIWRNDNSLWVNMLKSKYFTNSDIWNAKFVSNASITWKKIILAKDTMKTYLNWVVINGQNISLWFDKWCLGSSLWQLFIGPLPQDFESSTVASILDGEDKSNPWKLSLLEEILPKHVIDRIYSIPVLIDTRGEDTPIWPSKDGECTAKASYASLVSSFSNEKDLGNNRNWIWKSVLSPKLQLFLWKLSYDRLPTKSNLFWLTNKSCHVCCKEEETASHLFRYCRFTKLVRKKLHTFSASTQFMQGTLLEWLKTNAKIGEPTPSHNVPWKTIFVFVFWNIWLHRNAKIFRPKMMYVSTLIKNKFFTSFKSSFVFFWK